MSLFSGKRDKNEDDSCGVCSGAYVNWRRWMDGGRKIEGRLVNGAILLLVVVVGTLLLLRQIECSLAMLMIPMRLFTISHVLRRCLLVCRRERQCQAESEIQ